MKRTILTFVGLVGALSLLWVGVVNAANVRTGEAPRVMTDEVINGTLYASGDKLKIEGRVQGDLYCVGQNVEITGTIEGDVICAAQTITVSGNVQGDVRVAGQVVVLSAVVDGSATLVGQNVEIDEDAAVSRDLTVAAQQSSLDGTVGRDAQIVGTTLSLNGAIGRDLDATAEVITLKAKADVSGDFRYVSDTEATLTSGAIVAGETTRTTPEVNSSEVITPAAALASAVFGFASFLLLGIALLFGTPRLLGATSAAIKRAPFITILAGCAGLILPPFVALLLCVTLIGLPLGVIVLLGWIISLMLGVTLSSYVAGQMIVQKVGWQGAWQKFAALVLGLFAVFALSLVPFVGGIVMFAATVWGVGAIGYAIVQRRAPKVEHLGETK